MGKFLIIVAIIYVLYYGINILYDGFLKKTNVQENTEGDEFVVDSEEQPKNITVDDISYSGEAEQDDGVGARQIEMSVEESNIINGTVEDQGFTVNSFLSEINSQILGESKQMFAGVNF